MARHTRTKTTLPGALTVSAIVGLSTASMAAGSALDTDALWVYIGTYTRGESQGIYLCQLDLEDGSLTLTGLAAETTRPTFLALHPGGKWLYAIGEMTSFGGKRAGAVSAFAIQPDSGQLALLNQQGSGGPGPCHVSVDPSGACALVANYVGGSVACLPIAPDGSLQPAATMIQHEGFSSVDPVRQEGPHAHSINLDPAGRFAFAADLGLDQILVYRFDPAAGRLSPAEPAFAQVAPGAGPRHFTFGGDGRFAYVINELNSTITAFAYDADTGGLSEIQSINTLPDGFDGDNSTADIHVHPSGRFLYGSNRGHDSIVAYEIDQQSGKLGYIAHQSTGGKTPRNFGIDPTGKYLLAANQDTDNVVVFRIDPQSGQLQPTGHEANVPSPVCVKMMPMLSSEL